LGAAARFLPYLALIACLVIALFALIEPVHALRDGQVPLAWLVLIAWGSIGAWLVWRAPQATPA
jgi:hypothetical protein